MLKKNDTTNYYFRNCNNNHRKIQQFGFLFLIIFIVISSFVNCDEDFEYVEKNGDVKVFYITSGSKIRFYNRHNTTIVRPFEFYLVGETIDSIKKLNIIESTYLHVEDYDYYSAGAVENNSINNSTPNTNNSNNIWSISISDGTQGNLEISDDGNVTHYQFLWPGAENTVDKRELCFSYQHSNWYNSYQRYVPEWPMNNTVSMPEGVRLPFNYLMDFQTQPPNPPESNPKEEFYLILNHLFLTSDGFALMLNDREPLFIRRSGSSDGKLICISVNSSYPYRENDPDPQYRDIKINIWAAENIRSIWDYLLQNIIPKPNGLPPDSVSE